eukprot:139919_1
MSHKRTFTDSLDDTADIQLDSPSDLPVKRRRINNNQSDTHVNEESALLTIQIYIYGWNPLGYTPYWICGKSSKERFNALELYGEELRRQSPLTPAKFLSECRYPLLRFCTIPTVFHFQTQRRDSYCEYNEYTYSHRNCLTFETHDIAYISKHITNKVNEFHTKYLSKNKAIPNYMCNLKNNLVSHLFIIKQYVSNYNTKWNELMQNADDPNGRRLALPKSILKHALSPYLYELDAYQTIQYLDDNTLINQTEWFQYAFYFIEHTSYDWQKFFYEEILSNGAYNEAIMNMLRDHDKLTYRHFKYWKLTPLSLRLCSKKLTALKVVSWIGHSIRSNDNDLFEFSLKLFGSHSIQPKPFWGTLIFQTFREIDGVQQLNSFRKLCRTMKENCDGRQGIMDASFKKFNAKACKSLQIDYNNDVKFEMLNVMRDIIGYDVNSMVSHCCANDNFCLIQMFIEECILDCQICKDNGSVDMINEKLKFQKTKRNKIDSNKEFRDIFNEFISVNK